MTPNIYRENLMDHYKNPRNLGLSSDFDIELQAKNPMCGDELTIQLKIEDNKIKSFSYGGDACAVAISSASILSEEIIGKSIEDAFNFSKGQLLDLIGVPLTTSRIKCATLSLEALKDAINEFKRKK